MITINRNGWNQLSTDQLKNEVELLAARIEKSYDLPHIDEQFKLLAEQLQNVPSLELLEDLRAVILTSIEKGISESHKTSLDKIRALSDQIIATHPIKDNVDTLINEDLLTEILSKLDPSEAATIEDVNSKWKKAAQVAQIKSINENKLPIRFVLTSMTGKQAVEWILKHPAGKNLEYANFERRRMKDFDNNCLELLTKNCPNLKHLHIPEAKITTDGLKHLVNTPMLQSLNIDYCDNLEADALKHLVNTPMLQSLNIKSCNTLEADALKHLANTPMLQSLNIRTWETLEADALKHLVNTPMLQSLNIITLKKLEADALKHLVNTPGLQILHLCFMDDIEADALKHLVNTPELQNLSISSCGSLEADALKHLVNTPGLQKLSISRCRRLEADALKRLVNIPKLQSLNVGDCTQLEVDAPKHLIHVPRLQRLIIGEANRLNFDMLSKPLPFKIKIIKDAQ